MQLTCTRLPIALILAQGATQEARSALPGVPVVPHVDRAPVAPRTRRAVAGGLALPGRRRSATTIGRARPGALRRVQGRRLSVTVGRVSLQTIADHVGVSRMTRSPAPISSPPGFGPGPG